MEPHPTDPIALVFGLLFVAAGAGMLADLRWDGFDATAFAAAAVAIAGLLLGAIVLVRNLRADADPLDEPADIPFDGN